MFLSFLPFTRMRKILASAFSWMVLASGIVNWCVAGLIEPGAWERGVDAASTYQEWDLFSAPSGPNAPNSPGAPLGATVAAAPHNANGSANVVELSGASFVTSGGNIYSPTAITSFAASIPDAGSTTALWTTILLQTRTLGASLDLTSVEIAENGSSFRPVDSALIAEAPLGGFGGTLEDRWFEFHLPGNAAIHEIRFRANAASMSLDRIRVDTKWTALDTPIDLRHPLSVPEPDTWLLLGIGYATLSVLHRQVKRRGKFQPLSGQRNHAAMDNRRAQIRQSRPSGVTLIELLVVIAIIGSMAGLLLPAVQATREAARNAQCQSHLRQIGLAFHQYNEAFHELPPARQPPRPDPTRRTESIQRFGSAFAALLPFVEQNDLASRYDWNLNPFESTNELVSNQTISVWVCPTMTLPDANAIEGRSSYGISTGSGHCRYPLRPSDGKPDPTNHNGAIVDPSRGKTSVQMISNQDGAGRTALVGELDYGLRNAAEKSAGLINGGSTKWAMAYPGVTWCSMAGVFNSDRLVTGFLEWETFRSDHVSGVNFVMVDGAVRFVATETDVDILRQLAERNDGRLQVR